MGENKRRARLPFDICTNTTDPVNELHVAGFSRRHWSWKGSCTWPHRHCVLVPNPAMHQICNFNLARNVCTLVLATDAMVQRNTHWQGGLLAVRNISGVGREFVTPGANGPSIFFLTRSFTEMHGLATYGLRTWLYGTARLGRPHVQKESSSKAAVLQGLFLLERRADTLL